MAITSRDGLVTAQAAAQRVRHMKTALRTTVAAVPFSLIDLAGDPGAGVLAGTSVAAGVIPNDSTAGCPPINSFTGANKGYVTRAEASNTVAGRFAIYDMLWKAGAYSFNASQTLSAQPSYSARVPGGADYKGTEIYFECVTAFTGNPSLAVTYCVDPETEALTRRGWLRHNQITTDDEILAFDPATRSTRWEKIKEVFRERDYRGDMIALGGREFGALTTPDHRWPIETRPRHGLPSTIKVCTSAALPSDGYILRGARHEAPEGATYDDALVRLVAWYFTEGCYKNDGRQIELCQSEKVNPTYVSEIRSDIARMGAQTALHEPWKGGNRRRTGLHVLETSRGDADHGMIRWNLSGDVVDQITACAPGCDKVPTSSFIQALTSDQLEMFVQTAIKADGTPERGLFFQHHPKRMDAFMMAAALAGWAPSVDASGTTCAIRLKQGRFGGRASLGKMTRIYIPYCGTVWCPVTISGHWVARRSGKVFITGNTNQDGTTGHTTGTIAFGLSPTIGRMQRLPLQSGDSGVQKIESVVATVATVGTFNILVMRKIWEGRIRVINDQVVHGPDLTGMIEVFDTSALVIVANTDTTSSGLVEILLDISNG